MVFAYFLVTSLGILVLVPLIFFAYLAFLGWFWATVAIDAVKEKIEGRRKVRRRKGAC